MVWHRAAQAASGLAVGLAARLLFPGHDVRGVLIASALGMLGAWAAGLSAEQLRLYPAKEPVGFLMSALGAIALVLLYGILAR